MVAVHPAVEELCAANGAVRDDAREAEGVTRAVVDSTWAADVAVEMVAAVEVAPCANRDRWNHARHNRHNLNLADMPQTRNPLRRRRILRHRQTNRNRCTKSSGHTMRSE